MPSYHAPGRRHSESEAEPVSATPVVSFAELLVSSRDRAPEPLEWRPPPPLSARVRRAVTTPAIAAGVLVLVAVIVAIVMVWMRPHEPVVETAGEAQTEVSHSEAAEATASQGEETRTGSAFVHVVGEVAEPGIVELDVDARVRDAIDAAGGPTKSAVLAGVNLARLVVDGEQIVVPDAAGAELGAPGASPSGGGSAPGGGSGAHDGALVNLNAADATALETLPRVGPALAQRIIDWREANGSFASVDQLLEVSGIGEKTLEGFRDRVTV